MALTWKEVSGPDFSGVAASQRAAALALRDSTAGLSDALGAFGKSKTDLADRDFLAQISRFTDPASLDQALQAGIATGNVSPEALKFAMGRQDELLGNVRTGLGNDGLVQQLDQNEFNNGRARQLSDINYGQVVDSDTDRQTARNDQLAAKDLFASIAPVAADRNDMLRRVRSSGASPSVINAAVSMIETQGGALTGGPVDPSSIVMDQSLQGLRDKTEGAGDYSTLYGHSQKGGGQFAGTDVTKMTIDQALEFASPSGPYGQWVKSQTGKELPSTPMGRSQIVGSTLRTAAKELGLSGDTLFDAKTQDLITDHLTSQRLAKADSMAGKMMELRKEWEGFKSVPDDQLSAAIQAYERGDKTALNGGQPGSVDPSTGAASAIAQAAGENQQLLDVGAKLQTQAQQIIENSVVDKGMDQNLPMLADLMSSPNTKKSSDVAAELSKELPDIDLKTLTTDVNEVMRTNKVSAEIAGAFIKNAISENTWFGDANFSGQDRYVPYDIVNEQIQRFFDPKDGKMLKPTQEKLEVLRTKQNVGAKLQDMSTRVEAAKNEYFTAVKAKEERPGVDIGPAKQRYEALLAQFELSVAAAKDNKLITANTNGISR